MKIKLKRDSSANWTKVNPILSLAEIGLIAEADQPIRKLKIGDGKTAWNDLPEMLLVVKDNEDVGLAMARTLEKLKDDDRLDASAIKNLSQGDVTKKYVDDKDEALTMFADAIRITHNELAKKVDEMGPGEIQIQSDWAQTDNTKKDFIKNKPEIKPQAQSDWDETDTSKAEFIKNKPTIPEAQVQSDWSQSDDTKKDFIKNKPIIKEQKQSDWSQSDDTQSDYIKNKPEVIQSNWEQVDDTKIDYIKNKPTVVDEAPVNGKTYCRKDKKWAEIIDNDIVRFEDKKEFQKGEYCFFDGQVHKARYDTAYPPNHVSQIDREYKVETPKDMAMEAKGSPNLSINQRFIAMKHGTISGFNLQMIKAKPGKAYFVLKEIIPDIVESKDIRKIIAFEEFQYEVGKTDYTLTKAIATEIGKEYYLGIHIQGEGDTEELRSAIGFHEKPYVSNATFVLGSSKGKWASCYCQQDFDFDPVIGAKEHDIHAHFTEQIFCFSPVYTSKDLPWEQVSGNNIPDVITTIDLAEGENLDVIIDKEEKWEMADIEHMNWTATMGVRSPRKVPVGHLWKLVYGDMDLKEDWQFLTLEFPISEYYRDKPFNFTFGVADIFANPEFKFNPDTIKVINSSTVPIESSEVVYHTKRKVFKQIKLNEGETVLKVQVKGGNQWKDCYSINLPISEYGGTQIVKMFDPATQKLNPDLMEHPEYILDAPHDGKQYARKDGHWYEVEGGGQPMEIKLPLKENMSKGDIFQINEDGKISTIKTTPTDNWLYTSKNGIAQQAASVAYPYGIIMDNGIIATLFRDSNQGTIKTGNINDQGQIDYVGGEWDTFHGGSIWYNEPYKMNGNKIAVFYDGTPPGGSGYNGYAKTLEIADDGKIIQHPTFSFELVEADRIRAVQYAENKFLVAYVDKGMSNMYSVATLIYNHSTNTWSKGGKYSFPNLSYYQIRLTMLNDDTAVLVYNNNSSSETTRKIIIRDDKPVNGEYWRTGLNNEDTATYDLIQTSSTSFIKLGLNKTNQAGFRKYVFSNGTMSATNFELISGLPKMYSGDEHLKIRRLENGDYGWVSTNYSRDGMILYIISIELNGDIRVKQTIQLSNVASSTNAISYCNIFNNGDKIVVGYNAGGKYAKNEILKLGNNYEPWTRMGVLQEDGNADEEKTVVLWGGISGCHENLTPGAHYSMGTNGKILKGSNTYPMGVAIADTKLLLMKN